MKVNIGKTIELDVDTSAFTGEVMQHVIYIGLRNILQDSHAGITSTEDDYVAKSRAVAEKKLAAMLAGEVRVAGTRESTVDPIRREALRLADIEVRAMLRKSGKKLSNYDAKALRTAAAGYLDRTPELMVKAEKNLAEQVATPDINLADLGL